MTHGPVTTAPLTPAQTDRAAGVLATLACGDALGAGYEFQPARIHGEPVGMVGGGSFGWQPGEWTDDTSMAISIAEVAATGADLRGREGMDAIIRRFVDWSAEAADIGIQTRAVLSSVRDNPTAQAATANARAHFDRTGLTGNGSLMRTAPVALAYLHDPDARREAARSVSSLTHGDPEAGEACALWCDAIAHAVLHGTLDGLRLSVASLPHDRATVWTRRLDEAEALLPHEIAHNGWVVAALMAAWSAISHTPIPADDPSNGTFAAQHLEFALNAAVRAGNDTDTVAAIAGGLLGGRWGVTAIPQSWQRVVHGWPGLRMRDLIRFGLLTAQGGQPDSSGWPLAPVQDYTSYRDSDVLAPHPHDSRVLLGGVDPLRRLPDAVDAVVSLCRLGRGEVPVAPVAVGDHVEVWLVDSADPGRNAHLDFVLAQAAQAVADLRREGRTVLLHCVQAQSRTPTVAALYSTRHLGVPLAHALKEVTAALPDAHPHEAFRAALHRLSPSPTSGAAP